MTMKLFEYAVLYHPAVTKEDKDAGVEPKSELIVPVQTVLARSDKEALMHATREIPGEFEDKLDRVEIALRPF